MADFVNPFAAFYTGWQNVLNRQEETRQQRVKESQDEERLRMEREREVRAEKERVKREQEADLRMRQTQQAMDAQSRKEAERIVAQAGPKGKLAGADAEFARQHAPSSVSVMQRPDVVVPPVTPPMVDGMQLPPGAPETITAPPDEVSSLGSPRQRAIAEIVANPNMSERDIAAKLLSLEGENLSTAEADMLTPDDATRLFRRNTKGDLEESTPGKGWVPHVGPLPEKYRIINEPTAGAAGGTPYFFPIASAQGTVPFNARTGQSFNPATGQYDTAAIPLRPTGSQQQDLVNNAAALTQITLIKDSFNPDWVGPVMGRYNSMYTMLIDNKKNAELATMQTRVASLKNRFVKAITGAQMSEPEAVRIMSELPDMNLPPTTFAARIEVAEQNLQNIMELQQQVYTGMRRPTGNPITETQLNKLFPDSKFTGAPVKDTKAPARAGGAGTPAPKTKMSAAELIKKYGAK